MTDIKLLKKALAKIEALEQQNVELITALDQHRMVLEHYLNICASIQADPKPAQEVLTKYARLKTRPILRSVR